MANSDKDILITPNTGSSSADPKIEYVGADSSGNDTITVETLYDGTKATLSFEGSAGQLFSVVNDLTTDPIFSVNDVSGIPSIEVDSDGEIRLAEFSGNVGIGISSPTELLHVDGTIKANNLTLASLSAQNSEATAVMIDGSGIIGTRELGSNAFNSTAFLTGNQTITLSGDVSGSGTTSISVTIADDSHNHVISNVDGLQTALDAKLASSSYTAADVLTKIKTVDGAGSGLDADLLDGQSSAYYATASSLSSYLPLSGGTITGDITVAGENLYVGGNSGEAKIHLKADNAGNPAIELSDTDNDNYWVVVADDSDNNLKFHGSTSSMPTGIINSPDLEIAQGGVLRNRGQRLFTDAYHPNADTWTTARTITLGGDLTGNVSIDGSANVTLTAAVVDDSHNHIISNVDGLQTALDAKLDSSSYTAADVLTKIKTVDGTGSGLDADTLDGQHASAFLTGNQTITLSGDVSGSGTTSINVTVADDSHNHVISNVDGLQTALDAKASLSGATFTGTVTANGLTVDTDTLYVDSTNNRVGIGTTSPSAPLHASGGSSGVSSYTAGTRTIVEGPATTYLTIAAPNTSLSGILFADPDDSDNGYIKYDHSVGGVMDFGTAGSQRVRIDSSGNVGIGTTSAVAKLHVIDDTNGSGEDEGMVIRGNASNGGITNNASLLGLNAAASNSSNYRMIQCNSNTTTSTVDAEFIVYGNGNVNADGTFSGNGADYAEFFESTDGTAIPRGTSIVIENGKVRAATSEDDVANIIGVARPKEDGTNSMVIGNTAWNNWTNKYLTDDFGVFIMEEFTSVSWYEPIESEDEEQNNKKYHWYQSDRVPEGIVVPDDAEYETHDELGNPLMRRTLNPDYDLSQTYIPRLERDEWIIVGLMGQVQILKGQPVNDRWIKMRDISDTVEEWYIR